MGRKAMDRIKRSFSIDRRLYDFIEQEADENGIDTNAQVNIMLRSARDSILADRGKLVERSEQGNRQAQ